MILIEARKQSSDPIQQDLREKKANWNKKVSVFINDLINFKKLINGSASKFNMEKSKIGEPIPKDPVAIISILADNFKNIVNECNVIIANQVSYSQSRRKKVNHDLNVKASLNKDASNVLTRFFSRLKGPFFGKSMEVVQRRQRLSLLSSIAELYKLCSKFQSIILGTGKESINTANEKLLIIEDSLIVISKKIDSFIEEKNLLSSKKEEEENQYFSKLDILIDEWFAVNTLIESIDLDKRRKMNFLSMRFKQGDDIVKESLIKEIVELYEDILLDLNNKLSTDFGSLKDISEFILKKASVGKWIGKLKHELDPFDKTSVHRLAASDAIERIKSKLDNMMNSLEKEFNVDYLKQELLEIYNDFFLVKKSMNILLPEVKYEDLDLFRDERLKKLIKQKQLRDLSKRLLT
jgi:hypothetical protein